MSYDRDSIQRQYKYHAQMVSRLEKVESVMEEFGLFDQDYYLDWGLSQYIVTNGECNDRPYIKMEPKHTSGIHFGMTTEGPSLDLVETTPTLAEAARTLLPKVGAFTKSFDDISNQILLTATYKGVDIILHDAPPDTCTVRKIEDEIEVPEQVVAAHIEKKVRYVLEGDCDPLMATPGSAQ